MFSTSRPRSPKKPENQLKDDLTKSPVAVPENFLEMISSIVTHSGTST